MSSFTSNITVLLDQKLTGTSFCELFEDSISNGSYTELNERVIG